MRFFSTLIDGLSLGSIYAIIALGYTMVYGIAKMLNFAHGDVIMVGAYAAIVGAMTLAFPPILAIIFSIIVCAVLGFSIEKIAYKPLRKSSSLAVLITAIGVSYFLQSVAQLIFGSTMMQFPKLIDIEPIHITENLVVSGASLITLLCAGIIMISLTLFVNKTKTGRAMLAVSEDKDAARLMGINVNRTISITFIIGSSLAAIAGMCYGLTYSFISPVTGSMPGIKAFVAAVLGGIGSIPGAMLGGIILGLIENFAKAYISPQLSDAIVFAVLIIVLLLKPTGILGKQRHEKV
ncbi:MAG: branched-chain amino acid ABC transporter permease [Clostridia bacterium]